MKKVLVSVFLLLLSLSCRQQQIPAISTSAKNLLYYWEGIEHFVSYGYGSPAQIIDAKTYQPQKIIGLSNPLAHLLCEEKCYSFLQQPADGGDWVAFDLKTGAFKYSLKGSAGKNFLSLTERAGSVSGERLLLIDSQGRFSSWENGRVVSEIQLPLSITTPLVSASYQSNKIAVVHQQSRNVEFFEVVDVDTVRALGAIVTHDQVSLTKVTFCGQQGQLLTGDEQGHVFLWNLLPQTQKFSVVNLDEAIEWLSCRSGSLLAAAATRRSIDDERFQGAGGMVRVGSEIVLMTDKGLQTNSPVYSSEHSSSMVFSPDNQTFISASTDRVNFYTKKQDETYAYAYSQPLQKPRFFEFSPDGETLPVLSGKRIVFFKKKADGTYQLDESQPLLFQSELVRFLVFSPDGTTLALNIGADVHLLTRDLNGTWAIRSTITRTDYPRQSIAFSKDSTRMLLLSSAGGIIYDKLKDGLYGQPQNIPFPMLQSSVESFSLSPSGTTLAIHTERGDTLFYQSFWALNNTGFSETEISFHETFPMKTSPDDSSLVLGDNFYVLNKPSPYGGLESVGRILEPRSNGRAVRFSPDSHKIAVYAGEGKVYFYSVDAKKQTFFHFQTLTLAKESVLSVQ